MTSSDTQRVRRRMRPGRVLVTLLAAVVLLAGVFVGTQLLNARQGLSHTGATPTATATSTASVSTVSPGVTAGSTLSPCGTLAGPAGCAVPTPENFTGTPVLSDATPTCPQNQYSWNTSTGVTPSCSSNGLKLTATSSNTLGCVVAQAPSTVTTDGYAAFVVTPKSNYVALAFRQNTSNNQITGYYFALFPNASTGKYTQYVVYSVDASGHTHNLVQQSVLPQAASGTFTVGVWYAGNTFTLYVNNQQVDSVPDPNSIYNQGEFGMCTQGSATFRDAEVYKANG